MKYATLVQSCYKRIHNTCKDVPFAEKVLLMNDFIKEMFVSGYSENERLEVMKGALKTHANIMHKVEKGLRPYYRPNNFQKNARKCERVFKRNNWFKSHTNNNYVTVMFIDATPGDQLLKTFKDIENKYMISENQRIKFVSKSGTKLKNIVCKKDPFERNCEDTSCRPSVTATIEGKLSKCKRTNVSYVAECKQCKFDGKKRVYIGESARNIHCRSKEHYNDCKNDSKRKSWMRKHQKNEHENEGEICDFEWNVIGQFKKPLRRQLCEAVLINNTKKSELLNTKCEYFSNRIGKVELVSERTHCKSCGRMFTSQEELLEHMKAVHERFQCEQCSYISFGDRDMKQHTKVKHGD